MSADFAPLRQVSKAVWSLGDSSAFAELLEPAAHDLVKACGISPNQTVLDVGAGNGNCAIAAARRQARVTASDLSPAVLKLGQARAEAEGLEITWAEADAEDLPFADNQFDIVISAFGAIFARRPQLAASEMLRVLAPSGTLAMANWIPGGFSSHAMGIVSKGIERVISKWPGLPLEAPPSPFLWGDEQVVRSRFLPEAIELAHKSLVWEVESFEALQFLFESHGGGFLAKRTLPPDVYQGQIEELKVLVDKWNEASGGRVVIRNDYLLVLVRKL